VSWARHAPAASNERKTDSSVALYGTMKAAAKPAAGMSSWAYDISLVMQSLTESRVLK